MSEWQPIETAPCVGQKRLQFRLRNKKYVTGFRISRESDRVVPEYSDRSMRATHWKPIDPLED